MKKTMLLMWLTLCAFYGAAQTPAIYLKFNETNGTTTAHDEISNTNLPIANQFNKPERVTGVTGNALRTDGFSTYIQTPKNLGLGSSLTLETWLVLESYPSDQEVPYNSLTPSAIISQTDGTNGFALFINTFGVWNLTVTINGTKYTCQAPNPFPLYSWTHVAATVDGTSGSVKLFLNGAQVASLSTPVNGTINASGNPLIIGKSNIDKVDDIFLINALNGTFDETKVYTSALAATSIASDFSTGSGTITTTGDQAIAVSPIRFANDHQRPVFHALPPANWTNEPHGMTSFNGTYHLFFQRTPNGPFKYEMHWGHLISSDFVHWTPARDAIWPQLEWSPTSGYDMKGCWSGDVIVNAGVAHAFYTTVNQSGPYNPGIGHATSSDANLTTWTKSAPVIDKAFVNDFRDPYIFKDGAKWVMIIGAALSGSGGLDSYTSTDLVTWTHNPNFCTVPYSSMDIGSTIWEMPVFEPLANGKYILEANPIGGSIAKYGPKYTRAVYWIGTYVNGQFTPDFAQPKMLDVIHGHLSPTLTRNSSNQLTGIGIVDERRSSQAQLNAGWAHLFSLPRVWSLLNDNKTLGQAPAPQLSSLRLPGSQQTTATVVVSSTHAVNVANGNTFELTAVADTTTTATGYGLNLRISPDRSEITKLYYDAVNKKIVLDKSQTTLSSDDEEKVLISEPYDVAAFGKPSTFHIFMDNSVMDVFINEKAAFSARIYPTRTDSQGVELYSQGGNTTFTSVSSWSAAIDTVAVTGITLNKTSSSIPAGSTDTLTATITPVNATNKAVTWVSANTAVATVANGIITTVAQGTTTVTATTVSGTKTATCTITVTPPVAVSGITLNKSTSSIFATKTDTLTTTLTPANASNKTVTWASSNTAVATVTNGIVTGIAPGTATITATTVSGAKTATCVVTVTQIAYTSYDFESGNLNGWTVTSGTEFVAANVCSDTNWGWGGPFNQQGTYHFWGYKATGDGAVGAMQTQPFTLGGDGQISFLIGGGNDLNNLYIALCRSSDNAVLLKATGPNNEAYSAGSFNASSYIGTSCYIKVVDNSTGGFGHINVDNIRIPTSNIPVTGLTLNKTTSTIKTGKLDTLVAIVTPANASNKTVSWTSSNPAVASVSPGGIVTAVATGSATITATTQDLGKTASCAITVTPADSIAVTAVSLNKSTALISAGKTDSLTALITPANATNKTVLWTSSNTAVATVTNGVVTGLAQGTATITATTVSGGKIATCAVTIASANYTIYDFESGNLNGWTVTSGTEFVAANVCSDTNWGWGGPFNQQGTYHFWGFKTTGDSAVGAMQTQPFTLGDDGQISFLIGGGNDLNNLYIALCRSSDNTVLLKATGPNNEAYSAGLFNASSYIGTSCYIKVVDNSTGGFGHINVDNIRIPTSTVPVTGLTLNKSSLTIITGKLDTLVAAVTPANASSKAVTWVSSNTAVATVSPGGVVAAVTTGNVTITATTQDQAKAATCAVNVITQPYLVLDFESGDLSNWTSTSGTEFVAANVCTDTNWGWGGPFGQQGSYHFWGFKATGDGATGTMQTANFTLSGDGQIRFMIGGGNDIANIYLALCRASDNTILLKATGPGNEAYTNANFNAAAYIGTSCYIKAVDNTAGGFGHINLDNIRIPVTPTSPHSMAALNSFPQMMDTVAHKRILASPVKVYPVPVQNNFKIDLTSLNERSATLQIIDFYGKLIKSQPVIGGSTYQFSANDLYLKNGVYLIIVKGSQSYLPFKIIVNKN